MTSQWNGNTTAYQDRVQPTSDLSISLEMFPPANEVAYKSFGEALRALTVLNPEFISVTCGAGGSQNLSTKQAIAYMQNLISIPAAAHLTCIGKSKAQINNEVREYLSMGVKRIVALRGDLPEDAGGCTTGDYRSALDLVRDIRNMGDFRISVAAYPEGHPEAANIEEEIRYLKRKVDAGADEIITQFFFDTEVFLEFLDRIRDAGILVPVIPGILPIENFNRAVKFAKKCGTNIPHWYHVMFEDLDKNPELHAAISTSIAVEQCKQLIAFGIRDLHFYTLNRAALTLAICKALGKTDEVDQRMNQVSGF